MLWKYPEDISWADMDFIIVNVYFFSSILTMLLWNEMDHDQASNCALTNESGYA